MSTTAVPQADVHAAPTAESRFPRRAWDNSIQRVIDVRWLITEANGDKIVVELHCGHTTGAYYAQVGNRIYKPGTMECFPLSDKRLGVEKTKRYSKPAFERFAASMLDEFRRRVNAGEFGDFLRGEHATL